jgi:hypothetical protein
MGVKRAIRKCHHSPPPLRFVILGLDPRIHAGTVTRSRAMQNGRSSPAVFAFASLGSALG